jgi:hypothetical protein
MPTGLSSDQRESLLDWFGELACDVFAMRIVGPVFAVAFAEVTAPNRRLEPRNKPMSHPPASLRFHFLAQELRRFTRQIESSEDEKRTLHQYMTGYPRDTDPEEEIPGAQKWLGLALRRFRRNLPVLLGACEYKPDKLATDLPHVVALATRDIPPSERLVAFDGENGTDGSRMRWSVEMDWRSILNGILFWQLGRARFPDVHLGVDTKASNDRAQSRKEAIERAVGAIELSEFHRRATLLNDQLRHMLPIERESEAPA